MKNIEKYIIGILAFVAVGAIGAAVYFGINANKDNSKKEENKQEEVVNKSENSLDNVDGDSWTIEEHEIKLKNNIIKISHIEGNVLSIYINGNETLNYGGYIDSMEFTTLDDKIAILNCGPSWCSNLHLYDSNGKYLDSYESRDIQILSNGEVIVNETFQNYEPLIEGGIYKEDISEFCQKEYNVAYVTYKIKSQNNKFLLSKDTVECWKNEQ